MDQQSSNPRTPLLIKRGGEIPSGAVPMSDNDVFQYQLNRIKKFKPQSEMVSFKYSTYIIGTTVGISSFVIISTMRRNFQLGGLSKGFTYAPSVLVPAATAGISHEIGIKQRILIGYETCPTCVTLKSAVYQTLSGVCYPLIVSFLTCIPVARKNYTLPLPASVKSFGYVRLVKQVVPKSSLLLQLILGNLAVGSWLAYKQQSLFIQYFSS